MYYKIPVVDTVIQADYSKMMRSIFLSNTEALVHFREEVEPQEGWEVITEQEFESFLPQPMPAQPPQLDQQAAIDAIMAGMADMDTRQTQAIDALMSGIMDLYAQIETLKNGGTA
jgi:hypothetical protein